MIKAIAFDYGGVVEIEEGDLIREIADFLKITKEDWHKAYYSLNHLCNTGKNTWQEVLAFVCKEFSASDAQIAHVHEMIKEKKKTKKINLKLIEIIKDLKKKNYKIALLSNNSVNLRQKLVGQNIIDLFDEIIISGEVGCQKPSPEIFEILSNKLGLNKNELIFVDNAEKSLERAEEIGFIPLLYINNEKLREELSRLV